MVEDNRGKFIVLEGADNTGKSTIATLLSEWLTKEGISNEITRHPGSTPLGKELRKVVKNEKVSIPPIAEGLIMAADNNAFIELILKPSLAAGTWIISDRNNYISSMMYQIQSGTSWEDLDNIHKATHPNPPKIDILFILRASDDDRKVRKGLKAGASEHFNEHGKHDRFEDRGSSYNEGVAKSYDRLMEEQHERLLKFVEHTVEFKDLTPYVFYIDASKSIGTVLDSIIETIRTLLLEPANKTENGQDNHNNVG